MNKAGLSLTAALAAMVILSLSACGSDTVNTPEKALSGISITGSPEKTVYETGGSLELEGLKVTAAYSDGSTAEVTAYTTDPANGASLNTAGNREIQVSYTEDNITRTASFTVLVTGLAITQAQTGYIIGDSFSLENLTVTLYAEDETKVLDNNEIGISGFDSGAPGGTRTITVSYAGKNVNFPVWVYTGDGMIWIPSGTYTIGSLDVENISACIATVPQHQVILTAGFYMGKYQVTQAEYRQIMGTNPSKFTGENSDNLPVESVSWYNAVEFCNKLSEREGFDPAYNIDKENPDPNNKLADIVDPKWTVTLIPGANGYRLATEAQWEYACRAGTTTMYYTGDAISTDQANFNGTHYTHGEPQGLYRGTPVEVGSFAPNPWGLYDMHGNVWEWCWDWVNDGGENYFTDAPDPDTDPTGLESGNRRMERGGSWSSPPARLLSAYRERARPFRTDLDDVGIRVLRP